MLCGRIKMLNRLRKVFIAFAGVLIIPIFTFFICIAALFAEIIGKNNVEDGKNEES